MTKYETRRRPLSLALLGAGLIAALALLTGISLQQVPGTNVQRGVVGTIVSYDAPFMEIQKLDESTVTVRITGDTSILAPGQVESANALVEGASVAVLVDDPGLFTPMALRIVVKPQTPLNQPVTGAIVEIEGNVITILRPDGTTVKVTIPGNVSGLELGQVITIFARRGVGSGDPPMQGIGLATAEQVRDRLRTHLQLMLDDDAERTQLQDRIRERLLRQLAEALELREQQRLQMFERLQLHTGGLAEPVRNAVQQHKMAAEQDFQQAQQRKQEAIQKADQIGQGGPP